MPLNIYFLQVYQEIIHTEPYIIFNHKTQIGLLKMNTFYGLMHYKILCFAFMEKKSFQCNFAL